MGDFWLGVMALGVLGIPLLRRKMQFAKFKRDHAS